MQPQRLIAAPLADVRGAASTEYVLLLALVSVGASLALIAAGLLLLQLHLYQTHLLLLPVP